MHPGPFGKARGWVIIARMMAGAFKFLLAFMAPMTFLVGAWLGGGRRKCRLNPLQKHGQALADADAHGDQAILVIAALHFVGAGNGQPRPAHAQGMAKGDGAAVRVKPRQCRVSGRREVVGGVQS